jgi:hypothetical protein
MRPIAALAGSQRAARRVRTPVRWSRTRLVGFLFRSLEDSSFFRSERCHWNNRRHYIVGTRGGVRSRRSRRRGFGGLPLQDRALDAEGIVGDSELSRARKSAIEAVVVVAAAARMSWALFSIFSNESMEEGGMCNESSTIRDAVSGRRASRASFVLRAKSRVSSPLSNRSYAGRMTSRSAYPLRPRCRRTHSGPEGLRTRGRGGAHDTHAV